MVVAAVVGGADLLLILLARVDDDVLEEVEDDELDEGPGEDPAGPVMAVLEDVKTVTVEVDLAVKVLVDEGLHGDLVVGVPSCAVGLVLEGQVLVDGAAGQLGLLVGSGCQPGGDEPVGDEDGEEEDDDEEDGGPEATTDLPGEPGGDAEEGAAEDEVREGLVAGALGGEGSVGDGSCLGRGRAKVSKKGADGWGLGGCNCLGRCNCSRDATEALPW